MNDQRSISFQIENNFSFTKIVYFERFKRQKNCN